jgi:hypothetical protein
MEAQQANIDYAFAAAEKAAEHWGPSAAAPEAARRPDIKIWKPSRSGNPISGPDVRQSIGEVETVNPLAAKRVAKVKAPRPVVPPVVAPIVPAAAQTTAAVTDLSDLALASGLSAEEIVAECDPDGELLLELFASWGVCVAGKVALCTLPFLLPLRC